MRVAVTSLFVLLFSFSSCRTDCHSKNAGLVPATRADPPVVCPLIIPPDPHETERASCTFGSGATAEETLGVPASIAQQIPIRHVIVVMRENRSFDHLLGTAPASFTNLDPSGKVVAPFHAKTTCLKSNAPHQWDGMHAGVNDGAMDGFVKNAANWTFTDGHFAMSFYDATDLPFEHWLVNTWASSDRHFASVRSGTIPNRDFMLLATNDGVRGTGAGIPNASTPTLFDALDAAGLTWGAYSDSEILSGALGWNTDSPGCYCERDLFERIDTGTLPNVVFVDATPGLNDDHPPADLQRGEAWVRELYQHVIASPQWARTAMIWTYDEGGGFADHVPPPNQACVARPGTVDDAYFELGVRVPFVVVSPYARPGLVSHVPQEHTAVTRFIETIFGLPALTARDANSPALLDLFDFSCAPPMLVPPPAPEAGTGGCD